MAGHLTHFSVLLQLDGKPVDSIAGAVCAAELFRGHAARSEEDYNGEIDWALKWIGMDPPPTFDKIPGGSIDSFTNQIRSGIFKATISSQTVVCFSS